MKKTLLLCFIHGFKGGDETFGPQYAFTQHLRNLVAQLLPKLDVQVLVYPKYETRGNLTDCVSRFCDWLQEKVIEIEVAKGTPSPTVNPSVRVVLCGHSMGGIVAAEAVIALTSDTPVSTAVPRAAGDHTAAPADADAVPLNGLMFPYVQAVLSFDTPYLGIGPGVVAHSAETHYSTANAALGQLNTLAGLWGARGSSKAAKGGGDALDRGKTAPSPPPLGPGANEGKQASPSPDAAASSWPSRWGKMALYAGAGVALAGGAAAAYLKRDQLTEGWTWMSSHLEFVGCLARGEELRQRVAYMARINKELGVGFANLYTRLGKGAADRQGNVASMGAGGQRTFCNLPSRRSAADPAGLWQEAINDAAHDEIAAHMSMFEPSANPGYESLSTRAAEHIASWTGKDWYESSTEGETARGATPTEGL